MQRLNREDPLLSTLALGQQLLRPHFPMHTVVACAQVMLELVPVHVQEGWLHGLGADQVTAHEQALAEAVAATGCSVPLQCIPLQQLFEAKQAGGECALPANGLAFLTQMLEVRC